MNLESYPPVFRQYCSINPKTEDHVVEEDHDDDDPLAVIDLQCLDLERLEEACRDWGLFRLVNHGIPLTLLSKLQDLSKQLFSLSFEYKNDKVTSLSPLSYFWGTPALSSSSSDPLNLPKINWLEGFNVPLRQLSQFQDQDSLLHSFRVLLEEYGKHLARIASTLFEAMAKTLNLNPDKCGSYLSESTGFIRIYRYPPCSLADDTFGMEAHTDSSVLSILNHLQVTGLELFKDDKWLQIVPIPHTLIVNLGDLMQAISDDRYRSVKHRVRATKIEDKYSICYFVFPAEDCVIESTKYRPFTHQDFRQQVKYDIETVGFKVGLDHFKHIRAQQARSNTINH